MTGRPGSGDLDLESHMSTKKTPQSGSNGLPPANAHAARRSARSPSDPDVILATLPVGTPDYLRVLGAILKKFKRAVTDSDTQVRFDRAEKPGVSNLLEILAACTSDTPEALATKYTQYGPLKADAGEAVIELLRPIQARYHELISDRGELQSLLRKLPSADLYLCLTLQLPGLRGM